MGGLEARIPAMRVGRRKPIDDDDGRGLFPIKRHSVPEDLGRGEWAVE